MGLPRRRIAAAAVVLAGVAAGFAASGGAPAPAVADGLDFTCDTTPGGGSPPSPPTSVEIFDGVDVSVSGQAPGLGAASATYAPALGLDYPLDLDGDEDADLYFRVEARLSAGGTLAGGRDTRIDDLFRQNYALPNDVLGLDIGGVGVDVIFQRADGTPFTQARGDVAVGIRYRRADGSSTTTQVKAGIDALDDETSLFPDFAMASVLFKPTATSDTSYWGIGQQFYFESEIPDAERPPLGFGFDVERVHLDDGALVVDSHPVGVSLDWSRAPADFAVGSFQVCRPEPGVDTTAHLGWNRQEESAETPPPTVGFEVVGGEGTGIGGHDGFHAAGRVADVPQRLDWMLHPNSVSLARSAGPAPDVVMDEVQMASTGSTPYRVSGAVEDLPERVDVLVSRAGGRFARGEMVSCPETPAVPVYPTEPFAPCGAAPFAPARISVLAQNFLPDDAAADDVRDPPAAGPFVLYSTQAARFRRLPQPPCFPRPGRPCPPRRPLWQQTSREYFRVGAALAGVRRALFDATIATGSDSGFHLLAATAGEEEPTGVLVRLDGRRSTDDDENDGTLVDVQATASRWPADVSLVSCSVSGHPAYLEYQGAAPAVAPDCNMATTPPAVPYDAAAAFRLLGTMQVVGPGLALPSDTARSALHADAQFHIGVPGRGDEVGGGSTPSQIRLDVAKTVGMFGLTATRVTYDANTRTRLKAGAVVTTRTDRGAGRRTRAHVDVTVPAHVRAEWTEGPGAQSLTYLEVVVCERPDVPRPVPGRPPRPRRDICANQPDNRTAVTAVAGPPEESDADLLSPPELPGLPEFFGGQEQPPFMPLTGEGLRAVMRGAGRWGATATVANVNRVTYLPDPTEFCLDTRPTGEPFVANVYMPLGDGDVLYADAMLGRLPANLKVRVQDYDPNRPWIWFNRESCAVADPPASPLPVDPPGDIRLTATMRVGAPAALAHPDFIGTVPDLPPRGAPGIDVVAASLQGLFSGVHARVVADLPRHLMIWKPLSRCSAATEAETITSCQTALPFEANDPTSLRFRYASTALRIGDDLTALFRYRKGETNLDVRGAAAPIPGRVDGEVVLSRNRRLPWTDADVDFVTNTGLTSLEATVADLDRPAYVGDRPHWIAENMVPNYRVHLTNVPVELHVNARLRGAEGPTRGPTPEAPDGGTELCPGRYNVAPGVRVEMGANPGGERSTSSILGYVDADLDLGGAVRNIDILQRSSRNTNDVIRHAKTSDTPQTTLRIDPDGPLNGHVAFKQTQIGMFKHVDNVSYDLDLCTDFDLPLRVDLADVTDYRLGLSGAKVVEEVADGGSAEGSISEEFFCPECGEGGAVVSRLGAPYAYYHVDFDPLGPGDFEADGARIKPIALVGTTSECAGYPCYWPAHEDAWSPGFFPTPGHPVGYARQEFVMDLFFTAHNRVEMWSRDESNWPFRPGGQFFQALEDEFLSPQDFRTPTALWPPEQALVPAPVPRTFTTARSNCGIQEHAATAIGVDGTVYRFLVVNECRVFYGGSGFQTAVKATPFLVARHPNALVRWARPLETPDHLDGAWNWTVPYAYDGGSDGIWWWDVTITPYRDGSVSASVRRRGWGDDELRIGWLDPSGNGAFRDNGILVAPTVNVTAGTPATVSVTAAPAAGRRRIWYFGDGVSLESAATSASHTYPVPGRYFAVAVDYDDRGRPRVSQARSVVAT